MPPPPALPLLLDEDPTSMLAQKFGRETANYFAGSPLNRLSFLRGDRDFLRAAFSHPSTGFLLLNNLAPLVQKDDTTHLAFVSNQDVVALTGDDPFQKTEEEQAKQYNSEERHAVILFLGVDERGGLPVREGGEFAFKSFKGSAYFAVDVTPRGEDDEQAGKVFKAVEERGLTFHQSARYMGLVAGQGEWFTFVIVDGMRG